MKKTILSILFIGTVGAAIASDGGMVGDYRYTRAVRSEPREVYAPAQRVTYAPAQSAPCTRNCGAPVSVKTHTEVIDHYQVYQPVLVYKPAGTYAERRIVQNQKPCGKCGY